jgi:hypothetical protein
MLRPLPARVKARAGNSPSNEKLLLASLFRKIVIINNHDHDNANNEDENICPRTIHTVSKWKPFARSGCQY